MLSTRRPAQGRPQRSDIDPAALELIARHGAQILGTARRYSLNADDAEDAYQRGLEILLTKAPSTRADDLVPWLKTVVKHEAFAIRRQRERTSPIAGDEPVFEREAPEHDTGERAERYERLRLGAEALRRLKPQEVRCLLLRAEGYSYKQICELTGWSYTKVNRCLTEGRAAFLARLEGIQSGAECERLAPLLSALADGEATPADMAAVRPHLRSCLACRATLREYRAAPQRVAALLPPAALLAGPGAPEAPARWMESMLAWAGERTAALGVKAQGAAELVTGQKLAAVAASTAVLAGGGVATVSTLEPGRAADTASAQRGADARRDARPAAHVAPAHPPPPAVPPAPAGGGDGSAAAAPSARPAGAGRGEPEPAVTPEASEFDPTGNAGAPAPSPPPAQPAPSPQAPPAEGGAPRSAPSAAEAEFGL